MTDKMRDFIKGLIPGLVGAPLPYTGTEPVAYLYNGVRLPELPEWDKETYPYALINTQWNNDDGSFMRAYFRVFTSNAYYFYSENGSLWFGTTDRNDTVEGKVCSIDNPTGLWTDLHDITTAPQNRIPPPEGHSMRDIYTEYLTWANFKVEYDGVIYMESSEPVPIYD